MPQTWQPCFVEGEGWRIRSYCSRLQKHQRTFLLNWSITKCVVPTGLIFDPSGPILCRERAPGFDICAWAQQTHWLLPISQVAGIPSPFPVLFAVQVAVTCTWFHLDHGQLSREKRIRFYKKCGCMRLHAVFQWFLDVPCQCILTRLPGFLLSARKLPVSGSRPAGSACKTGLRATTAKAFSREYHGLIH